MVKLNNLEYTPLISVVMSVYNGGKYLAEAIESILRASLKTTKIHHPKC